MSRYYAVRKQLFSLAVIFTGVLAVGYGTAAQAADRFVSSATSTVDCVASGIGPGDTITLESGNRGKLSFKNCFGQSGAPIVIRNDTTGTGQVIIQTGDNDIGLHCDDCEYVTIDGTGKWSGAGSDDCGMRSSWPDVPATPQCGIKLICTSGNPNSLMRVQGSSKNYTIKGIEFDGNYDGACTGDFQTLNTNDGQYKITDHPGEWREGILIDNNYFHDTSRESMYVGSNVSTATNPGGGLPQRNNEISYNYMINNGCDAIDFKTSVAGSSSIHHNYIDTTGVNPDPPSTGCGNHGISLFEGGYTDVYNNFIKNTMGSGARQFIQKQESSNYATLPSKFYNNLIIDSAKAGISVNRAASDKSLPVPEIYNNTIVNSADTNINIGSNVPNGTACIVRDNVVADTGSYLSATECAIVNNNKTDTKANQKFVNAAEDDFNLTESSPARNNGSSNGPTTDYSDRPRLQEGKNDQGALEFVVGGVSSVPNPPPVFQVL